MNKEFNQALATGNNTPVVLIGKNGQAIETISSLEVSEMVEKPHNDLLKDIRRYITQLAEGNLSHSDFFIESTYLDANRQSRTCYQVTRKGCELIANKLIGTKGTCFTARYVNRFHSMENYIKQKESYMIEDPIERAKAWILEQQEKQVLQLENKQQQQIIGELQPKASYYDLVLQSTELMPITLIAKDYGMSANAMNKTLFNLGVQYNQCGTWLLYAKHHARGYTQSKTQTYQRHDGTQGIKYHTYWTQKGRLFLYSLLKENNILPVIERENN